MKIIFNNLDKYVDNSKEYSYYENGVDVVYIPIYVRNVNIVVLISSILYLNKDITLDDIKKYISNSHLKFDENIVNDVYYSIIKNGIDERYVYRQTRKIIYNEKLIYYYIMNSECVSPDDIITIKEFIKRRKIEIRAIIKSEIANSKFMRKHKIYLTRDHIRADYKNESYIIKLIKNNNIKLFKKTEYKILLQLADMRRKYVNLDFHIEYLRNKMKLTKVEFEYNIKKLRQYSDDEIIRAINIIKEYYSNELPSKNWFDKCDFEIIK